MIEVYEILKNLNFPSIVAVVLSVWFFNRGVRADIKELKDDLKEMKTERKSDMDKIEKEFKFFNIRLARTEGTVYGKDIYNFEDKT